MTAGNLIIDLPTSQIPKLEVPNKGGLSSHCQIHFARGYGLDGRAPNVRRRDGVKRIQCIIHLTDVTCRIMYHTYVGWYMFEYGWTRQ